MMMPKRKVFLSGAITGDPDYKAKFNRVAADLEEKGHIVLNPATLPRGLEYADYARICHAMLEAADTVVMLPDYPTSPGAKLEMSYALYIGKDVQVLGEDKPINKQDKPKWNGIGYVFPAETK